MKQTSTTNDRLKLVAPRAGAWIENPHLFEPKKAPASRPARARGLNRVPPLFQLIEFGRAPRGGVD